MLTNKELLNVLGFEKLTVEWCSRHDKIFPIDFISQLKEKVKEEYERVQIVQQISINKLNKFKETTKSILSNTFSNTLQISNNTIEKVDYDNWYFSGIKMIFDKSSFAENQEAEHLNYDSFVGEKVSMDFNYILSQTTFQKKTKSYLIKSSEFFDAVEKITNEDKTFVILNFGVNIAYYNSKYKIKNLNESSFNSIPIIKMGGYSRELIGESFFILKKSDLPCLLFNSATKDIIEKYRLEHLNETFNFYGNVIDLYDNPELIDELIEINPVDQLKKSVLVCVILNLTIKWKKDLEMTQIRVFSEYRNNGLPNNIDEIE